MRKALHFLNMKRLSFLKPYFRKVTVKFVCFTILAVSNTSLFSCAVQNNQNPDSNLPSWYLNPKQNSSNHIFGVAEGYTMEEATRYALADAASRLMVSISSESEMTRQADQNSSREEIRQKTRQSVEKVNFTNYKTSRSKKSGEKFYVEIEIEKLPFLNEQKERAAVVLKKIREIDASSEKSNLIQRRLDLIKIIDLCKELELEIRILSGAGHNSDLGKNLQMIGSYQVEFSNLSSKIDFVIDENAPKGIANLVKNYLNKEGFKIVSKSNKADQKQIIVKIKLSVKTAKIYEANISKIQVHFENYSHNKLAASNNIEVSGSSSVDEAESENAAFYHFEEKIKKDGILKILGII